MRAHVRGLQAGAQSYGGAQNAPPLPWWYRRCPARPYTHTARANSDANFSITIRRFLLHQLPYIGASAEAEAVGGLVASPPMHFLAGRRAVPGGLAAGAAHARQVLLAWAIQVGAGGVAAQCSSSRTASTVAPVSGACATRAARCSSCGSWPHVEGLHTNDQPAITGASCLSHGVDKTVTGQAMPYARVIGRTNKQGVAVAVRTAGAHQSRM